VKCPECGASVRPGESCRDHFHALLALEWQVPGGPGEPAHFHAVASFLLQRPVSMGYLPAARYGLQGAWRTTSREGHPSSRSGSARAS
jgi:hypothetical protein